ncbi:MAG TPA: XdhC family protein [Pyrinomonadaceae bacterium]|nr:XdhC family protein [Pyrinomonadaceae bacterium]
MKELQEILKKVSQFAPNEKAILATVVDVQGSGYRRAGARMLIDENGYSIGTISGGCLEADVLERARKVLETGEPTVLIYDTTKDKNSVFGLGMGCRGIVRILLEEMDAESSFFDFLQTAFDARKSFTMATFITSNNESLDVGARYFLQDSVITFKTTSPQIPKELSEELKRFSHEKNSKLATFDFGEVFFETINPPINLRLFGAGYDALPLIRFAKEIGWRVSVVDHRAAFANAERLAEADEIFVSRAEDLSEVFFTDENSVAVVMTHNYDRDCEILPRLLHSKFLYIGALGPKTRTEKILNESGETFSDEQLKRLHAPIGLDIGASSPEAIALSIIAEINAVLSNRNGGFLRERKGSIYDR